jgi:uncharacterized protein YcbK (DUF882 family)
LELARTYEIRLAPLAIRCEQPLPSTCHRDSFVLMLPLLAKIHIATSAMTTMTGATTPGLTEQVVEATLVSAHFASPIEVHFYDENDHQDGHVAIWRDGSTDTATAAEIKKLFRCRKTHYQKQMAKRTLAMLAAVSEYFDKEIVYASAVRVQAGEPVTSPHRDARAVDFRVPGVSLAAVRDFLWRNYSHVGVGWYPNERFIHIDSRPNENDCAWTFYDGVEHYHPYWAELARQPATPVKREHRAGS